MEKNIFLTEKTLKSKKEKQLNIDRLEANLKHIIKIITVFEDKENFILCKYYENIYNKFISKTLLEKEIMIIAYYNLILNLNKFKFEDKLLFKLKTLISRIYNKEIEFNIINLKTIYLNSNIFTEAISLKLKNRSNKLLKVLRSFLYMVKLPKVNVIKERFYYNNPKKS